MDRDTQQALALAGVLQQLQAVDRLARSGMVEQSTLDTAVHAILATDPPDTLAVFGDLQAVQRGVRLLAAVLDRQQRREHAPLLKYALAVRQVSHRLRQRDDLLNLISERLSDVKRQAEHLSPTHESVVANLSRLYQDTLSTLDFRIQVGGDGRFLQQHATADKIRTLLLAAVRCALLWEQVGGNLWQLALRRRHLAQATQQLGRA